MTYFARTIVKMQHKVSVKFGHGHFGQIRFLMKKSSKDSIYIYILSLGEKIFSFLILTEMTMTGFDRNHPKHKAK